MVWGVGSGRNVHLALAESVLRVRLVDVFLEALGPMLLLSGLDLDVFEV